MQESKMPATVKVPPIMAQICKRRREGNVSKISATEASGWPPPVSQEGGLTHEDTLPMKPILFVILSPMVFRAQRKLLITCVSSFSSQMNSLNEEGVY